MSSRRALALVPGLAVVFGLVACGARPPPAPPIDNQRPGPALEPFEIRIKRTICFGRCPAYSVTVNSDGTVRWHGDTDVAALGDRRGTVTAAQLAEIAAAIDRAQFFSLQRDGTPPCTAPHGLCDTTICSDTSRSIITVTRGGRSHEIDNAHCVDSPADALEELVEKLANTDAWVGH